MHTTNYTNTLIEIAEDSLALTGEAPPEKEDKTVAQMQFEMIKNALYKYNSDEVIFGIHTIKKDLIANEAEKAAFFSKGQACFRASPLGKRYGWGIHHNHESKIALYACDSIEYMDLKANDAIKKVRAMQSGKPKA